MRSHATPKIVVAVMAKAPIPGEAKTRLGAEIGSGMAAMVYRAFLLDTLDVIDAAGSVLGLVGRLLVAPNARHADQLRLLAGDAWSIVTQSRSGLMGGIADAFDAGFARGADVVVVADADSPLALRECLADCLAVAREHDVGLGPTADGGYYLITARAEARRHLAELLLGVAFDSATIAAATVERARRLGLTVGLGPAGFDVDTRSDLLDLAARLDALPIGILGRSQKAIARTNDLGRASANGHAERALPFDPAAAPPLP